MTIELQRYKIDGFDVFPFKGSVDAVTYYGYDTTYGGSAAFEQQETMATTIYLYKDITTGNLSLQIVLDAYENSNSGSVVVTIGGLPSSASLVVQDDDDTGSDSYTWVDNSTLEASFNWGTCCTDGMVLDQIGNFSNISINVNASNGVDKFKVVSSSNNVQYINFSETTTLQLERSIQQLDSYLYLQPKPSIYTDPITISTTASDEVDEVIYTEDGSNPTLAEYLAYDNQDPPNPFIAVVQDGLGNVLFDGGFPKWYNQNWNDNWSVFSDMSATYKYLANALEYISNKNKVQQGNKDILIIGDANSSDNYNIKNLGGIDFNKSFSEVCSIMGYNPTFKTRSDYGGQLDMTFSELNQYCAVILMSSRSTSSRLITQNAVDNLITSREQGNGILIVTDHGEDIASLNDAINTSYTGFFRTANYIAVRFNAYFTGSINRSPVNIGHLRSTYGDHILWNNINDSEDIESTGSESSVVIKQATSYAPDNIPLIDLKNDGYHTYKYLLKLNNGSIVTESYTYGLNVDEIVEVYDENNNLISQFGPTNYNNIQYDFNILPGNLGSVSGYIKKNNKIIGDFIHDGSTLSKYYYTYDQNNPFIKNNDQLIIDVTTPLEYTKTIPIIRNQRDVKQPISFSRKLSYINRNEWENGLKSYKILKNALKNINKNKHFDFEKDFTNLRNYMLDLDRLPKANTLIYDNDNDYNNAKSSIEPPTPSEIFSNWGVFSSGGSNQEFYNTLSDAPDQEPYSTWSYDETNNRVIQTANVSSYTGFVNNIPTEKYIHEVTLTSSNSDDDGIGVIIAYYWDETNDMNHHLSVVLTKGGVIGNSCLFVLSNYNTGNRKTIATRQHDDVSNGWSGDKMRVKIERDGDYISIIATKWNDLNNYDSNSEVILDLNSDPDLQQFRGPKKYGYSTISQSQSTYIDINFSGGLNYNLISNASNGYSSIYKDNSWEEKYIALQTIYNYPRVLSNPKTGKEFLIQENSLDAYWGDPEKIEVIGERYYSGSDMTFKILNYDPNVTYTFNPSSGSISQNNEFFTWSLSNVVDNETVDISNGTYNLNLTIYKEPEENNYNIYTGSLNNNIVYKFDNNANIQWKFTEHYDAIYGVAVDQSGNVYSASSDQTVRKIDSSGNELWQFAGHGSNNVYCVAVDISGNVYSGSTDQTVRKIDSSGNEIWQFIGHGSTIHSVAVDQNGNVYSASSDQTVRKIDSSGNEIWQFTGHGSTIHSVAVDQSGNVYSSSGDQTVRKIDSSGNELWQFSGHSVAPQSVAVDQNGNVYSGGYDQTVRKIDSSGNELWQFNVEGNCYAVAIHKSGIVYANSELTDPSTVGYLYKLDSEGNLFWKYGISGDRLQQGLAVDPGLYGAGFWNNIILSGPFNIQAGDTYDYTITNYVSSKSYSATTDLGTVSISGDTLTLDLTNISSSGTANITITDGNVSSDYSYSVEDSGIVENPNVYTSSINNDLVYKLDSSGNEVWTFSGHTGNVYSVAVDLNGNVYSSAIDNTVRKIDSSGNEVWTFSGHTDYVRTVAVDLNGNIYSGSYDETVRKLDPNGNEIWQSSGHSSTIHSVAVDRNGNIYSGSYDETVRKLDPNGNEVWSFTGHTYIVYSVAVDQNSNVYSSSGDTTVRKIDSSGNEVWSFTGHTNTVFSVAVDQNGNVYSGSTDGTVRKIDSNGNEVWLYTITGDCYGLTVDQSGNVYANSEQHSPHEGFVFKLDSDGNQIWVFDTNGDRLFYAIAVDPGLYGAGFW
ncbi:hypothetical protein PBI_SCTP2_99 [Salicola phage SCTP-2]|nr:hypothetical protein PBI_SCTP2_99 [Salicola phage SCTP-2]